MNNINLYIFRQHFVAVMLKLNYPCVEIKPDCYPNFIFLFAFHNI